MSPRKKSPNVPKGFGFTHWGYRVISHKTPNPGDGEPPLYFQIHRMYYDFHGGMAGVSTEPVAPFGDTPQELRQDMQRMLEAFDRPPVAWEDLPATWFK